LRVDSMQEDWEKVVETPEYVEIGISGPLD
jgi:hypothetical protein